MDKEERAVYMKSYCEANKEKKKGYDKALYETNKDKVLAYSRAYYSANKQKVAARQKIYGLANKACLNELNKKLGESEGIGVYKAVYPSGIYIGSGQVYNRRRQHLNGNTTIAKTLKEKAISFEVVCLKETKLEVRLYEQKVIDWYGLDSLLNSINVKRRNNDA